MKCIVSKKRKVIHQIVMIDRCDNTMQTGITGWHVVRDWNQV